MSESVRAAAERLARYIAGRAELLELLGKMPPGLRLSIEDTAAVANAYLAEHPSDDDEPATPEWLRSVGFLPDGDVDKPDAPLAIGLYYGRTDDEIENGIGAGRHLLLDHAGDAMVEEYDEGGTVVGCVEMPSLPTRGHVRRLCAALGVSLPQRSDP